MMAGNGRRRFENRVVVVTGGASGLGEAMAQAFAAEGGRVAVADIRGEGAQKVADAAAGEARGYTCDVSDSGAVRELFDAVASDLGDVDVLVNNAGIARRNQAAQERMLGQLQAAMTGGERESLGATKELSDEDWDRMLRIHLYGTFYCTREALKVMERNRRGAIVNISSVAALAGLPGAPDYSAAKAGIIGITRSVAQEVSGSGIRVERDCTGVDPHADGAGGDRPAAAADPARAGAARRDGRAGAHRGARAAPGLGRSGLHDRPGHQPERRAAPVLIRLPRRADVPAFPAPVGPEIAGTSERGSARATAPAAGGAGGRSSAARAPAASRPRRRRGARSSRGWSAPCRPGCAGHGVSTTPATSTPAARAHSSVIKRVADRAEPRPRRDHDRHAEVGGEVAHEVVAGQRDQQPADSLRDQHVAGARGAAGRGQQPVRINALAGSRRGQVGGHRGAEAVGSDLRRRLRRAGGGAQAVVVGAHAAGFVQACDRGLEDRHARAERCQRGRDRRRHDRLADLRVRARHEQPTWGVTRPTRHSRRPVPAARVGPPE